MEIIVSWDIPLSTITRLQSSVVPSDCWLPSCWRGDLSNVNCQINAKQLTSLQPAPHSLVENSQNQNIFSLPGESVVIGWAWGWLMKIVSPGDEMDQQTDRSRAGYDELLPLLICSCISRHKVKLKYPSFSLSLSTSQEGTWPAWLIDDQLVSRPGITVEIFLINYNIICAGEVKYLK